MTDEIIEWLATRRSIEYADYDTHVPAGEELWLDIPAEDNRLMRVIHVRIGTDPMLEKALVAYLDARGGAHLHRRWRKADWVCPGTDNCGGSVFEADTERRLS